MKIKNTTLASKAKGKDDLKNKTDKELIEIIQFEYNEYRKNGYWLCDCGRKRYLKKIMSETDKKVVLKVKCTRCYENIERFIARNKDDFYSKEYKILFDRYKNQIKNDCSNFKLEDPDDMYGDMSHRFFIAVMTYDGRSAFSTYLTNLIKRRFEDFERKYSRACRTTSVQCQCCGAWTGAITRNHLMMNKKKPVDGFIGHQVLHDKIIDDYGRDKFNLLDNENTKVLNSKHWEGNDYNKTQRQLIKSRIVQAYREMFPNSIISMNNIYMSEKDPETETEYINTLEDKKSNIEVKGDVRYNYKTGECLFVADTIPSEIKSICRGLAYEIGMNLHNNFQDVKKINRFKIFRNREEFINMLSKTFALMLLGYSLSDICEVEKYDIKELKFWLKYIKDKKEFKTILNFG